MTHDAFHQSSLRLIASAFSDLADLLRKEIRLALAEMAQKASSTVQALIFAAVAGVFGLIGLLVAVAGLVLFIAAHGLALYWSCFIVAAGLIILAGLFVLIARSRAGLTPERSLTQLRKDMSLAKEQAR